MATDVAGLALSLAFSVGACVGGGWWCVQRWRQARILLDTPTSKIRSAAQGFVELYGVLKEQAEPPLRAPLTDTPCVWWRYRIEECSRDSNNKLRWRVVESGTSEAWLRLADATGECLIDPRGAEVRAATRQSWHGSQRHPLRLERGGLLSQLFNQSGYRYKEERLHAGEPLYAIGDFHTQGGGRTGLDLERARGEVVREWKQDFQGLLTRFDSNADGRLDEPEWQRVQLAAGLEAEQRHRQASLQPAQNIMRRPGEAQPFLLSSSGEDDVARSFQWQAAAGAVACLLGALATAWLLQNAL